MGMDVYGKNPTSDKGSYFRNNVWYWHPLWDYCLNLHGDIAGAVEHGHSNDGDGLDGDEAHELGFRLMMDIERGTTAEYEREYNAHLASLPTSDCPWCEGTGIRTDDVGVEHEMPTRALNDSDAILFGRTHGWCNGCNASGVRLAWETNYPFTVENVREFAEFLLDCGGFEIC
jgi:hypothetical protein